MVCGKIEGIINEEVEETQLISIEIAKDIEKILRRKLREQSRAYDERLSEKYKQIDAQQSHIFELESTQKALLNKIKWDKKPIIKEDLKKTIEEKEEHIDWILSKKPPKDWHCANVGNFKQVADAEWEMDKYCSVQHPTRVAQQLADLIRLVERFERELETMDQEMNRWVSHLIASRFNMHQRASYMGMEFYNCPHCGKNVEGFQEHITKLAKGFTPEAIVDTKPYPKIKV
jgi:hypothetical protein